MLRDVRFLSLVLLVCLVMLGGVPAQTPKTIPNGQTTKPGSAPGAKKPDAQKPTASRGNAPDKAPQQDITKEPTLYVVGYAHLDTQWRWEFPQTNQ